MSIKVNGSQICAKVLEDVSIRLENSMLANGSKIRGRGKEHTFTRKMRGLKESGGMT